MRRVKAKSLEQAVYLMEVRKDFSRYLKKQNKVGESAANWLQAHVLVEITCPICKSLFADTVDAEEWAEGRAWVWCRQPGHRHEIQQSDGTMGRVENIRATWCAGSYFTLGMEVTWMHRKRDHLGELVAIAGPCQDALRMIPSDTPKGRLKIQSKNDHGYRAVLKNQKGSKQVYYVVSLNNCSPADNASSRIG